MTRLRRAIGSPAPKLARLVRRAVNPARRSPSFRARGLEPWKRQGVVGWPRSSARGLDGSDVPQGWAEDRSGRVGRARLVPLCPLPPRDSERTRRGRPGEAAKQGRERCVKPRSLPFRVPGGHPVKYHFLRTTLDGLSNSCLPVGNSPRPSFDRWGRTRSHAGPGWTFDTPETGFGFLVDPSTLSTCVTPHAGWEAFCRQGPSWLCG